MRTAIITADDFGVSRQVNEAVEQAHRAGILTVTSLMVTGAAAADAVARARANPTLGVGLHVALAETPPALPASQIPDLVDKHGAFRIESLPVALALVARPAVRRQLEAEIDAQFALFAATDLPLDHVNSHKHMHLHPVIGAILLKVGLRHGMKALRAPIEDRALLAEPVGGLDIAKPFARRVQRSARRAGVQVPDRTFGLAWSGEMRAERVRGILETLPGGVSEIYLHPATGPYPLSAPGYQYEAELAALTDPGVLAIVAERGITLARFGDL
ncbi:hopanoid biosynthesis-associated protein HpnK [Sphingomonas sp. HMP6]|uniref:hopanoid biosynthesis-associated protein HpnK n=1 Tax=Sphingomonas sp. HMP6 TaxID=1517551 RepID=UPI001596FFA5|nr:hopanoid biosynthesis-associated protein HpnK [Sphingomonas sp. HMP6]BCA58800.1 hopanoid biosynthesis associated protein HpnK [Sphingomonas sp. HMP6]